MTLVARLCKENPPFKERLLQLLALPDGQRLACIDQWLNSLPPENDLRKSLKLLIDGDIALALLEEIKEYEE